MYVSIQYISVLSRLNSQNLKHPIALNCLFIYEYVY